MHRYPTLLLPGKCAGRLLGLWCDLGEGPG